MPFLPGRQHGGGSLEAIGIRAAGPQPEVAPNHERLGRARVALIVAGWWSRRSKCAPEPSNVSWVPETDDL